MKGVEWQQVKAYALVFLSSYGGGVTILTAVEPQTFSQKYIELVQTIARGVEFSKPETPPIIDQYREIVSISTIHGISEHVMHSTGK